MKGTGWAAALVRDEFRSWRFRIWAALFLLFALALTRLPLFGVLGFESAFVTAVLASIAGAHLGSAIGWRSRLQRVSAVDRSESAGQALGSIWIGGTLLLLLLLAIPLAVLTLGGIWIRNCDWLFGFRCYVLMPVLSGSFAVAVGMLATILTGHRKWLRKTLPFLIIAISTILSVIHFYRSPAVFSYNPFAGYFPGNLFDENIDLRAPFYWARFFQFCLVFAIASIAGQFLDVPTMTLRRTPRPHSRRIRGIFISAVSSLAALCLWLQSGELRFSVGVSDLEEALPGRYESEHFVIHYPADPGIANSIEAIADDHEFRRAQLVRDLGVDPPEQIHSFYFTDRDQKHELMGARNVYMAKPWRNEIYLNHEEVPHQVVRHEIAHVMAGAFGSPIFRVSAGTVLGLPVFFNISMIEGIAVASDWPDHFNKPLTPHQSVKAMQEMNIAPQIATLFSTGFLTVSSARSYTVAGSYLRFLLDRYGIDKLQRLYRSGGDIEEVYGRSLSALTEEWRQIIADTSLPEGAVDVIRERFRRPAIFNRPCPHAIARAREQMMAEVAVADYKSAIGTARKICQFVPKEPTYQMQLATLLTRSGGVDEAIAIYSSVVKNTEHIGSSLRARAHFELVDIHMSRGETEQATARLQTIMQMPLADDDMRRARVQYQILTHPGPAAQSLQAIFWGQKPGVPQDRLVVVGLASEAAAAEPNLGLPHYLIARQLHHRGFPQATIRALRNALTDVSLDPLVEREAAKLLAEAANLAEDLTNLEYAAGILVRSDQPQVIRLLGYDWFERLHWHRHGQVPDEPLGWREGKTQSGPPR